ncbi:hypothetical protein BDZ89DRAFT_1107638 [Hymenopellis radicata]|nr:hypothetical protein BDZ89DRAFT_1107638 [Hymenopellis radicata]
MTIRYERSTFPGGYRPYDDHLNPQIDTLDAGNAVASKLPPPVDQSQRYVSRTVDLTDSHPVDGRQQPRYHLDGVPAIMAAPLSSQIRLPSPLQVPSIPISKSPRYRASPPLSASSQSTNPPVRPRRKPGRPRKHAPPTGNDKLTPGNLSLLDKAINIPALKEPAPALPGIDHLFIRPMSSVPRLTRPLPSTSPQMRLRQHTPPPPLTPESPLFTSMVRACSDRLVSAVKASCVQLLVKEREEKDALRRELDELKRRHLLPPYSADIIRPRPPPFQALKRPSTAPPMALSPIQASLKKRRVDSFEDVSVVDDDWSRRGSPAESVNSERTQVDDGGAAESFTSALDLGVYRKLEQLGSFRSSSRSSHSSRGTVVNGNNDVVLAKFFE